MVEALFNFKIILYISFFTILLKVFKKRHDEQNSKFKVKIKIKGDINELKNSLEKYKKIIMKKI